MTWWSVVSAYTGRTGRVPTDVDALPYWHADVAAKPAACTQAATSPALCARSSSVVAVLSSREILEKVLLIELRNAFSHAKSKKSRKYLHQMQIKLSR
ncbi:hypothetical protein LP420_31710 [Massilia sp. B-10]|nr:hypothetical protein LP420_31710 [Massilia sp. B-10]UUZ53320.1 hypothetical protein LP419_31240 [Massilia sp. H-1]